MTSAIDLDWRALVKIARSLAGRPRFPWVDRDEGLRAFVGTDFAGCVITRKSTSGGLCCRGPHVLKHWSVTQKTIALSSGEAELAGVVKGSAEGLGMASLAADLGLELPLEVCADSSAAIGICRRTGIGKIRHLATGQLWVQERVRQGDFIISKIVGTSNPADILTKAVAEELLMRHGDYLGLVWESGRAQSAPLTADFEWGSCTRDRRSTDPRSVGGHRSTDLRPQRHHCANFTVGKGTS